jgi:large subunit ribosomal protein L10
MAITKQKKQEIIKKIKENLEIQKASVFVGFKGIKAKDLFDLREKLKKDKCLLKVMKKTLLDIVLKEKKIDELKKKFAGEIALIFGFEDEILPAKIVHQFSLKNENIKILGGIFPAQGGPAAGWEFVEKEKILALALLPSRQELLAKVVSTINAPVAGLVNALSGNLRGLVYILSNIKK